MKLNHEGITNKQPGLVVFRKLQSDAVKPERERDID